MTNHANPAGSSQSLRDPASPPGAARHPLTVETYKDGRLESSRTIYLKSKRNREWLAKHEYWAGMNKRTIILIPRGCTHIFDYDEEGNILVDSAIAAQSTSGVAA